MFVMMMFVLSIFWILVCFTIHPLIHVHVHVHVFFFFFFFFFANDITGVKELVTLTSDLSSKNLAADFECVDSPGGPLYRVFFDVFLTLDGSEFNAMLVCQGEVMGRCRSKFR